MLALLVTGSRTFANVGQVFEVLDSIRPDRVIVGDARGVDRMVVAWCNRRGIPCSVFAADWDAHGRSAGHIRNSQMVDALLQLSFRGYAPTAAAFFAMPPNDASPGTAACIRTLRRRGIEPVIHSEDSFPD